MGTSIKSTKKPKNYQRTFKTNIKKVTIGIVNGDKYFECINSLSKKMKINLNKSEEILDFIINEYPDLIRK